MKRSSATLVLALLTLSCRDRRTERPSDQNTALGGEVAARVGSQAIPLGAVVAVAAAQDVPPREAVRKLVDDEIAASAARAEAYDRREPTSWLLVSARARFTADVLAKEARALGPPTDAEVDAVTARHWVEEDRPATVRVMHAIVLRPKDEKRLDAARTLAAELQSALVHASNDEFEAKAKAVSHDPKLVVRVERLPADITEDGRVAQGNGEGTVDPAFAKAAYALPEPGATSGVVEGIYGFHVIRLLERIPEKRTPLETRRAKFTEEVYVMRARDRMNARLAALKTTNPVAVESAAEQLMRTVKIAREAP